MPSNHLILCLPLLLLPSIFPSIRKERRQEFPGSPVWTRHFHCQGWVCSLVRKLRSHEPPRAPPTKKKGTLCMLEEAQSRLCQSKDRRDRDLVLWSTEITSLLILSPFFLLSKSGVREEVLSLTWNPAVKHNHSLAYTVNSFGSGTLATPNHDPD